MKSAFWKDIFRSIKQSMGRFIAIASIVALGVGFFAGLNMTGNDMRISADTYYDNTHLMDVRVISTLGMTEDDIQAFRNIKGVDAVMPSYESDMVGVLNDSQYSFRVHSLPNSVIKADAETQTTENNDKNYLNRLTLAEGRYPQAAGECVICADRVMSKPNKIGDTIEITESLADTDSTFSTRTFKIVGYVHSSYYMSKTNMGTTSLGNGAIDQFMYVSADSFAHDFPYTEAFLTVQGASDLSSFSNEYSALVKRVEDEVKTVADERAQARTAELKAEAQKKVDDARTEYENQRSQMLSQLNNAQSQLDSAKTALSTSEQQLQKGRQEYESGLAQYESGKQEYEQGLAALETYKNSPVADPLVVAGMQTKLDAAKQQLDESQMRLNEAKQTLSSGQSQLESGRAEYETGLANYNNSKAHAYAGFEEAEQKLADAQKQVEDIPNADYLVMDRSKNYGCESYKNDAARMDNIAKVFPLFFFLVAALVALTTMTRMVEEERQQIGTFKALGYSSARIASKYLIYAFLASLVGSVVGIAILSQLLPWVVQAAYAIIYYVPTAGFPIDIPIASLSALCGICVTLIATIAAAYVTLRERPASLMLPRAPKAGKRILLERIAPLWKRLGFLWKITLRNLFLYKKRFIMTVIGIAGCSALMLTGFGLNDSINDILNFQFGPIVHYNVTVNCDSAISDENKDKINALLDDKQVVSSYTWVHGEKLMASPQNHTDIAVDLIAPQDAQNFSNYVSLKDRASQKPIALEDDGVILSEKLATLLGVKAGDEVTFYEQDVIGNKTNDSHVFKVVALTENYAGHYVYMTPQTYKNAFEKDATYARAYAMMSDDEAVQNTFSEQARSIEGVKTVSFNNTIINTYRSLLSSVTMIVFVLIAAAAILAFIVLYNLTNINITERKREIATLKVLGFKSSEINAYIFREIFLLSIIGAAVGLLLGIVLESFVILSAEVDMVMFGRVIHASSFIISFVLTLVFAAFVMIFMHAKLRKVDMVESLKSVE